MKKKIYYRYNPQTLSYERVYPSLSKRIFNIVRNLLGGIIIGAVGFWLITNYVVESPHEVGQRKEINMMRANYEMLSKRFDGALKVMKDMQQRDDNMYRAIFHAEPIPQEIRYSGYANMSKYEELMSLNNPEMIVQTNQKLDLLNKQLYIQSKSFDDIVVMIGKQKDRLLHVPSIQPVANKDLSRVASGYGMRIDPVYGTPRFHAGMDFTAKTGTDVYVTGNGTVTYADWKQGYGNCIIIDHGYGYETLYAHLDSYNIKEGQQVVRGEKIGEVGNTGKSTGPHLHYEVRVKGKPDNPANYYFMDLTAEEYDQMLRISANHGQVMD
ncbi:M23 family metallopeptidase [Dysgonomonas sp. 520]|uniref:M23 family metallopeptidase n=1 Tax=Dysgonomonas sp. 520 TaxID=2302931 RepID=UPI0013D1B36D|nr:M23 family metallopeptidase [Dysgonomonas sp. 520]NDW10016.1 M23 family peptidase [Dysgonomonas sp. 520]